jgi:hypothetical protein
MAPTCPWPGSQAPLSLLPWVSLHCLLGGRDRGQVAMAGVGAHLCIGVSLGEEPQPSLRPGLGLGFWTNEIPQVTSDEDGN